MIRVYSFLIEKYGGIVPGKTSFLMQISSTTVYHHADKLKDILLLYE